MFSKFKAWLNGKPTLGKKRKTVSACVRVIYQSIDASFTLEFESESGKDTFKQSITRWWSSGGQHIVYGSLHIKRDGLLALHVS
jgi:hypothetical protein